MRTIEYIITNEKTYTGIKDIKFLFCECKNSDKLILTFPGFPSQFGGPPTYNYVRTLKNAQCHRLFILDNFGPSDGSYLIGENRDNSIEISVMSLISDLCNKYGIKCENIITQGSSKGGYIALYYGLKYGFGYIIAGGPQTLLGSYLTHIYTEVMGYIAGGDEKNDIIYLDNLLYDLIDVPSKRFPKIFIHVGSGDHHYEGHILPFIKKLDEKGIEYKLDLEDYDAHSEIGFYYPNYLLNTLNAIDSDLINLNPPIENLSITYKNNMLKISCDANGEGLEYACDIIKEFTIIKRIKYQKENNFTYPINSKGIYRAMIYVKEKDNINTSYTEKIKIDDFNLIKTPKELENLIYFNIHGSAISRLIFDLNKDNEIVLKNYFANQSFISSVSDPLSNKVNIKFPSIWENKMLEMDLKKELFEELSAHKSDYLLIDLVDEENSLVKQGNTIFTLSKILEKSNFWNEFDAEYINRFEIDESIWKRSMDLYVEGLLKIYNEENIIIHETYLKDVYISKNRDIKSFAKDYVEYIKKVNKLLEKYYGYLKEKLPNSKVINIHHKYIASENHIWGLSPVHYVDKYYQEANEKIRNIISNGEPKPLTKKPYKDYILTLMNKLKF